MKGSLKLKKKIIFNYILNVKSLNNNINITVILLLKFNYKI